MPRANRVQLAQVAGGLLARPAATSPREPRLRGHSTADVVPNPHGDRAQRRAAHRLTAAGNAATHDVLTAHLRAHGTRRGQ